MKIRETYSVTIEYQDIPEIYEEDIYKMMEIGRIHVLLNDNINKIKIADVKFIDSQEV